MKIVERGNMNTSNTQRHDRSLSWLGTYSYLDNKWWNFRLVLWSQTLKSLFNIIRTSITTTIIYFNDLFTIFWLDPLLYVPSLVINFITVLFCCQLGGKHLTDHWEKTSLIVNMTLLSLSTSFDMSKIKLKV